MTEANKPVKPLDFGSTAGLGVLVCEVGGVPYYGSALEAAAVQLEPGAAVRFQGVDDEVSLVWFYDGPIVNLKSGRKIFPALGQLFEVLTPNVELSGLQRLRRKDEDGTELHSR